MTMIAARFWDNEICRKLDAIMSSCETSHQNHIDTMSLEKQRTGVAEPASILTD